VSRYWPFATIFPFAIRYWLSCYRPFAAILLSCCSSNVIKCLLAIRCWLITACILLSELAIDHLPAILLHSKPFLPSIKCYLLFGAGYPPHASCYWLFLPFSSKFSVATLKHYPLCAANALPSQSPQVRTTSHSATSTVTVPARVPEKAPPPAVPIGIAQVRGLTIAKTPRLSSSVPAWRRYKHGWEAVLWTLLRATSHAASSVKACLRSGKSARWSARCAPI
jgi:hypothetical protein